jgi:hypothetical protein
MAHLLPYLCDQRHDAITEIRLLAHRAALLPSSNVPCATRWRVTARSGYTTTSNPSAVNRNRPAS